jgi:hypothetical protein
MVPSNRNLKVNRKINGIMGLRNHPHASASFPTVTFGKEKNRPLLPKNCRRNQPNRQNAAAWLAAMTRPPRGNLCHVQANFHNIELKTITKFRRLIVL